MPKSTWASGFTPGGTAKHVGPLWTSLEGGQPPLWAPLVIIYASQVFYYFNFCYFELCGPLDGCRHPSPCKP